MENMSRYEILMLAVPEITQDEIKELEKQVDRVVQEGKGSIISFERWGKYRLAYPVRKNDYGVYFLARFQAPANEETMKEVRTLFTIRFETVVMRAMVSTLENGMTLEYQRPRSLEEAPPREEGGFSRDRGERRPRPYASSDDEGMPDAPAELDEPSEDNN